MQGTIFLGKGAEPEPEFHFAFRGRMDERIENARALCNKRFLYIRNYMPYVPWLQHLDYLWKMKATQAWDKHAQSGNASEIQSRFFAPKNVTEELYDMQRDPDSVVNIADNPEYAAIMKQMRTALHQKQVQFYDSGLLPESEMVKRAADHKVTIYDMVRDAALYDLALEQ